MKNSMFENLIIVCKFDKNKNKNLTNIYIYIYIYIYQIYISTYAE